MDVSDADLKSHTHATFERIFSNGHEREAVRDPLAEFARLIGDVNPQRSPLRPQGSEHAHELYWSVCGLVPDPWRHAFFYRKAFHPSDFYE